MAVERCELSIAEALERVLEASRGVVERRLALAGLEARQAGSQAVGATLLLALAGALVGIAWLAFLAVAHLLLVRALPAEASLALLGAANAALAALLGWRGRRRLAAAGSGDEA